MKIEEVQKWLKNNIFKKDGQFNTISYLNINNIVN
jgi:hypothetical protein